MVEIFDASALTVSPAMSAIIVRTAEMISKQLKFFLLFIKLVENAMQSINNDP
jgi:hypothetical protein